MRIVAINAVVFLLWAAGQIPISVESTVNAMFVVVHLRAMALTTQSHYVREFDSTAICKLQRVVVGSVVAGEAADCAV